MLDLYSDFTQHQGQLGTHIEIVEMCDLAALVRAATEREIRAKEEEALAIFELAEDSPSDPLAVRPAPEALDWAYRVAVGLDRLVADFALDGLTYYYRGLDHNEYERIAAGFALGCSLLTSRGVPCSGEGDLKNCQAMKIVDTFGAGGSYSEVTAMDFRENFILAGHDGPFHLAISSERPLLRGLELFHGKRGGGVGVETQVRHGPVTLLSMTQTRAGDLKLVAAQGDSIPGPVLQIGNTDSRLQFSLSVPGVSARRHALEASRSGIRRRDTGGSEGLAVCQRSLSWAAGAGGSRSRLRRRRRAWCAARAWLCVQRTAAKGRKGSTCCPKRAKLRSLCSRCTIESSFRTDVRLTAQRRSRNHGRYFAWCGPDLRPMTTSDRNAPKSRPAIPRCHRVRSARAVCSHQA